MRTDSAFQKFLEWLDDGADSDGLRYLEMRGRLARYFDRRGCLPADELADETLSRVERRLQELGAITDASPGQYCFTIAKFVFLEHTRQARRLVSADALDAAPAASTYSASDEALQIEEALLDCLELCLKKLLPDDSDLVLEYYRGEKQEKIRRRRELAASLGVSSNALTIRACRIRERLEECTSKCIQRGRNTFSNLVLTI